MTGSETATPTDTATPNGDNDPIGTPTSEPKRLTPTLGYHRGPRSPKDRRGLQLRVRTGSVFRFRGLDFGSVGLH